MVFPGDADVVEGLRGTQAISQLLIKLQAALGILSVLKIVPGCDVVSAQGCERVGDAGRVVELFPGAQAFAQEGLTMREVAAQLTDVAGAL